MIKSKNLIKRITAVASAAVIYTASMCGSFIGSPMEKYGLQNTIIAEAASVLDGAEYIATKNSLQANHWYMSKNGQYGLIFQGSDGNLVIYRFYDNGNRKPYWASGTDRCDANLCQIQDDGNFVIYDKYRRPVWTTDSYQTPATLYLNNNGELFIYSRKTRSKVWSSKYSSNPNGTRIYQPSIEPEPKPAHTHTYKCYCENGSKWYYGCTGCHSHDHEVGVLEYVERSGRSPEEAMTRYFELLGYDSTKIKAVVKAYSSINTNRYNPSSIRNNVTQLDNIDTDLLPNCKAKDIIESYQDNKAKMKAILDIYDLFQNAKNKTIGIDDFDRMINGISLAFNEIPLANETYGNVLENMKEPAKKSIIAGLKHNYDFTFNGLPNDWVGGQNVPGSADFWDEGVKAKDLRDGTTYDFGTGKEITIEKYFENKFDTKSQAKAAYTVFKNLKCIQEVTGESFWELVKEVF